MQRLLLLFIFVFFSFSALSQDWQWVRGVGGPNFSETKRISTDASGNSYVLGNFAQSIRFGTTELQGSVDGEVFLIKYDSDGNLKWAKKIGGSSVVEGIDLFADAHGNTFITGNFKGTATIGAYTLTSPDDRGLFVVKLDTNGNILWAKQGTSSEGDVKGHNITVDQSGNTYVTGNFFKSATFGSITINATKDEQVFIARYNSNGDMAWVKMAGGLGSCFTHGITTDNSGNLYLTGQFWQKAVFGATTLYKNDPVNSPGEIFLAKYDASGNALWAKQAGGAASDAAQGIVADNDGNIFLTGFFQKTAVFGSNTLTGNAVGNVFLAKYNTTGNVVWVKNQSSSGRAGGFGISRGNNGNLYVVGTFEGTLSMGVTTLESSGDLDLFVAQYDANGNVTTAIKAGGIDRDEGISLAVKDNNFIYLTGSYSGPATFGTSSLTSVGYENIVVGNLIMRTPGVAPTIATGALNNVLLCPGTSVNVQFTTTGTFNTDNLFIVQLSNENGSFSAPIIMGSGKTSPITANIPANVSVGNKYRIRVISQSPDIIGATNGVDLQIGASITTPGAIIGNSEICIGTTATYSVTPVAGANAYTWELPANWAITEGQGTATIKLVAGSISEGVIKVTASNSCQSPPTSILTARSVGLNVTASVTSASILVGSSTFLSAKGADTYTWSPATGLSDPNVSNPVATPAATTTYTVTGTKNGCISTAKIVITVRAATVSSEWVWANQGRGVSSIESTGIATDANGNVYVTGNFYESIILGNTILTSTGGSEIFLIKYDASGKVIWAKQAGGPKGDASRSITTDVQGNILITGYFGDASIGEFSGIPASADFGMVTLKSSSQYRDIFTAKYDPNGNIVWAKRAGGSGLDEGYALTTDVNGNIYATGYFGAVASFGSQTLTVNGGNGHDAFIVKYDAAGNTIWAKQAGGPGLEQGRSIAVDATGNIFVTGFFDGSTAFFDSFSLTNFESWNKEYGDIFVVKYAPGGDVLWAKQVGGANFGASRVVVGKNGSLYVMGNLLNTRTFGASGIPCRNGFFLANFNTNGNVEWVKQPQWGEAQGASIAIDKDDNISVTGNFDSSVAFGDNILNTSGKKDVFVVKYDAAGSVLGASRAGGHGEDSGSSLITNTVNEVYITGSFQQVADFGGNMSLSCLNQWMDDFFVAKLRVITPLPKSTVITGELPATFNTCSGKNLVIPFTATGLFNTGNTFVAHLSDENGSFAGFYSLGTSLQSPIVATMPRNIKPGTGYKIRVVATSPYTPDDANAKNIVITTLPQPDNITGILIPCPNQIGLVYSIPAVPEAISYSWTIPVGWFFMQNPETASIKVVAGTQAGYISVTYNTACGTSAIRSVYVEPNLPLKPTVKIDASCDSKEVILTASGAPKDGSYKWYVSATGGLPISNTNTYITHPINSQIEYYVASVTEGGCESTRTAVIANVLSKPTINVNAGPDETICEGTLGFLLTGASPAGGQWTGKGIETTNGYFSPASAGAGTHELTYSINQNGCTVADTKIIIINKAPAVTLGTFKNLCTTIRDYVLTGGQPAGGVYSGIGVKNGLFTPVDSIKDYTIAYTYTDNSGCDATDWQPLLVETCTGILESKLASHLVVYPNPTKADIQIELPLPSATSITLLLFDVRGQKLLEKTFVKVQSEFKQGISLRDKSRGMYLLQLILKDGVISKRIVVE